MRSHPVREIRSHFDVPRLELSVVFSRTEYVLTSSSKLDLLIAHFVKVLLEQWEAMEA